jgi:hypothetical protein
VLPSHDKLRCNSHGLMITENNITALVIASFLHLGLPTQLLSVFVESCTSCSPTSTFYIYFLESSWKMHQRPVSQSQVCTSSWTQYLLMWRHFCSGVRSLAKQIFYGDQWIYVLSRVRSSVTNNNGFWIGWLELLTPSFTITYNSSHSMTA